MSGSRGLFITFEGGEGAGKSTAARALAEDLRSSAGPGGREIVLTREPGGTAGAEAMRGLLLDPRSELSPLADTMLHFAARADHVAKLILPSVARGAVVICDRYYDSTMAYQGYGSGVDVGAIAAMIRLINFTPDLTFILEAPDFVAKQRLAARGNAADRYDLMGDEFMARVASGFRNIAVSEPERCVLVDATGDAASVLNTVKKMLGQRLGL